MDRLKRLSNIRDLRRGGVRVSQSARSVSSVSRCSVAQSVTSNKHTKSVSSPFDDESTTPYSKHDPIQLDLSVYDEYGNRTVPIYRRSVKLQFDAKEKSPASDPRLQKPPDDDLTCDYHLMTGAADLKCVPSVWKSKLLDDEVITAVTEELQTKNADCLFVNPCLTQCILFAKVKHVPLFLDPLRAKTYPVVFFVLNDSRKTGGSSHWSLLAYNRPAGRLFHFDSMHNTNYRVAYELAQKVCEYLNVWALTDVYCEQQTNSVDCGYYVIDNIIKLLYMMRHAAHMPLSQINRFPSMIEKTKNFVVNVHTRTKGDKSK